MTNEELFDDLKQFIATQNSQLEERLRVDMEAVEKRILDGVADVMTQVNEDNDARLDDHEKRLGRLEHRAA